LFIYKKQFNDSFNLTKYDELDMLYSVMIPEKSEYMMLFLEQPYFSRQLESPSTQLKLMSDQVFKFKNFPPSPGEIEILKDRSGSLMRLTDKQLHVKFIELIMQLTNIDSDISLN